MNKEERKKQGDERALLALEYRKKGLTYKEICEKMGVSYIRVRQLVEKAERLAQREWVGLTNEEKHELWDAPIDVIEAKLKEKNCAL